MADPIEAARASEETIASLTKIWLVERQFPRCNKVAAPRQPTLHERYRSESHGDQSFGQWLKTQGLPCA